MAISGGAGGANGAVHSLVQLGLSDPRPWEAWPAQPDLSTVQWSPSIQLAATTEGAGSQRSLTRYQLAIVAPDRAP